MVGRDASFFGTILVRSLLPSFNMRRELKSGFGQLLRKGDTTAWRQERAQARNWQRNRGTLVMASKPTNPTKITPRPDDRAV